jgi:hypothetical protein
MENLKQGTQPDRMKGALHTLGNKAIGKLLCNWIDCIAQRRIPVSYSISGEKFDKLNFVY